MLNVILRQKSKFLNTVVCCLVTQCSKQNKKFRVIQNRGHGPWSSRSDGTASFPFKIFIQSKTKTTGSKKSKTKEAKIKKSANFKNVKKTDFY